MKHKFIQDIENKSDKCLCCYCSQRQRQIAWCCCLLPVALLVVLISTILIRAATLTSTLNIVTLDPQPKFMNLTPTEEDAIVQRFSQAIQIRTVSYNATWQEYGALGDLQSFLRKKYPHMFDSTSFVTHQVINNYSLLFRIQGSVPKASNPYLLCAHLDVVPEGDLAQWSRPPFSGDIFTDDDDEEYIFGRGAIDDKQAVIGILEALQLMILEGHQPQRSFYVAFGHDEEVSGNGGAGEVAKILQQTLEDHEEELSFILDEGMFVMDGVFPGVEDPVAYIGVVEKGWSEVNISVKEEQGHSSTPPKESAIGILSKAISTLEETGHPSRFGDSVEIDTMEYVAPFASFGYKVILGNMWLFKPIVSMILSSGKTDAIQRTTTAVTILRAGIKNNVVPGYASALVNHRVHPADEIEQVLQKDAEIIGDPRVHLQQNPGAFRASGISRYSDDFMPFRIVVSSVMEIFPRAHVTPGIMVANTDTKHYQHLCDSIYRFQPVLLGKSDLARFHGIDERINRKNFLQVVQFYYRLIRNADFDLGTGTNSGLLVDNDDENDSNHDDIFEALQTIDGFDLYEDDDITNSTDFY